MTYRQCRTLFEKQLQTIYDAGEAAAITKWAIAHFTRKTDYAISIFPDDDIEVFEEKRLGEALTLLLQHKPIQYVTGHTDFCGFEIQVDKSVLIPRPETEELAYWVSENCRKQKGLHVLDIGTGSGCIAIALKKFLTHSDVSAIDISVAALEIAYTNALKNNVKIIFQQLNFLNEENWKSLAKYNTIVSNPPYIPLQEKAAMDKNVTDWEPATALFVPDENPLLFYEKIALFGKEHLLPEGKIFVETHRDYAADVKQLFIQQGYSAELRKDLHGNERMVKAF